MQENEKKVSQKNNGHTPVKKRRRYPTSPSVWIVMSVCIILAVSAVFFCIIIFVLFRRANATRDTGVSTETSLVDRFRRSGFSDELTEIEVSEMLKDALDQGEAIGRQKTMEEMRDALIDNSQPLDAFRSVFKEYTVMTGEKGYIFIPVDPKITPCQYPEEYFSRSGDGAVNYKDGNGFVPYKGIDVSVFQDEINWDEVADYGIDFAFVRVGFRGYTEGGIIPDDNFQANIEGALTNGIHTGVYFFSQATNSSEVHEEVDFVLSSLRGYHIDGPIVIDVEEVNNGGGRTAGLDVSERTELVKEFCRLVKKAGYEPMIYGNLRSMMLMLDLSELEDYDKWFAYYRYPIYFKYDYSILQYSDKGRIPGIPKNVDMNLAFRKWW